ncbi:hypothetical protein HYT53_01790 [Candidatus Woesearchaeota archaeon]|nr:hypothetical protein [Candidatus Woesearchaeota archaeon]
MVKGYCKYCLSGKKEEVEQCPHCQKHFCSEHITPIEPGSYRPEKSRIFINQIRLGHENTHPCPDYVDYLEEQKTIHGKKYGEALDKLLGSTPKYKLPLSERQEIRDTRHNIAKENEEFNKSVNAKLEVDIQRRKEDKIKRKELEKEKHRQEIEEKERLSREIEEKQKKHLKKQEKDEPYLYRYISPEERKSNQPPKVPEKYKKEHVGTAHHHHETPKEETAKEKYYKKEESGIFSKLKINRKNFYVVGTIILLLLVGLFYGTSAKTIIQEIKNVSNTKTISSYENISNKISFSNYLNDIYAFDKQEVTLNGFLERSVEGDGNAGVHVFSIVDDYNNRVVLEWSYNNLKKYLPDLGKTKELYSVQGIFKREYKTLKLNVENINIYKREPAKQVEVNNIVSYTEQITINRTSPKYPLVRNLVFKLIGKEIICEDGTKIDSCSNEKPLYCSINGLKEEPAKCGCPSGKRLYQNQCINEVKCSDGTYEPECSKNKPKQCVNGKLVDNPEVCNCPENYKVKDKKCVYIRCSDGTIEPDCSAKMKMQCMEGNFIYNPNKCGCPDGYVKRGNNCVKTCSDGTAYDECSDDMPLYCDNDALINKASICGCPSGSGSKYKQSGELCLDLSNPDIEYIEEKVHELINLQRQTNGLSKLSYDTKLVQIARAHSQDMATNDFFSHDNLRGEDPTDRASKVGYNCRKDYGSYYTNGIAENIHQGWTYGTTWYTNGVESSKEWLMPDEISESAVTGWMNSPGHRKNILTNTYDKEGIGVAVASNGAVYITQDFC